MLNKKLYAALYAAANGDTIVGRRKPELKSEISHEKEHY